MKLYKMSNTVVCTQVEGFNNLISDEISKIQNLGFQVEVQYQIQDLGACLYFTALILGYTEED